MKHSFRDIITTLVSFGERQFDAEKRTLDYIETLIRENEFESHTDTFDTFIPRYNAWSLTADGVSIPALPCGFVSGTITNSDTLISSLISSQKNFYDANINFNPRCPTISRSNHYGAPALAVARESVHTLLMASAVRGCIDVTKECHVSANILVGNRVRPKSIVICHYDSIGPGAVDNGSGVALILELLQDNPELQNDNLFVLCGNEELSYDQTVYWGHGYRVFETQYANQLRYAQKILILDSFGFSNNFSIKDPEIIKLAFPVDSMYTHLEKTTLLSGDYQMLMKFYHAENDLPNVISETHFGSALTMVKNFL